MNRFDVVKLAKLIRAIHTIHITDGVLGSTSGEELTEEDYTKHLEQIKSYKALSDKLGLSRSALKIGQSLDHFSKARVLVKRETIATEARNMLEAVLVELSEIQFLSVPTERAKYIDNDNLFGPEVTQAFPSASVDLREAGNCLAADCNTAAVFHLMRAVEWGMRALCSHFRLTKIRRTVKKTGKKTYTPISYEEWQTMLNQLQAKVDSKVEGIKRGTAKQEAQEFYYPILQDLRAFRDAWRNHVMHARAHYSPSDAEAICDHVRRFMTLLATRISERRPRVDNLI